MAARARASGDWDGRQYGEVVRLADGRCEVADGLRHFVPLEWQRHLTRNPQINDAAMGRTASKHVGRQALDPGITQGFRHHTWMQTSHRGSGITHGCRPHTGVQASHMNAGITRHRTWYRHHIWAGGPWCSCRVSGLGFAVSQTFL